ncbi:MAG TPA: hypothetical protein VF476_14025, partial [Chitinophagaceae bacterium]
SYLSEVTSTNKAFFDKRNECATDFIIPLFICSSVHLFSELPPSSAGQDSERSNFLSIRSDLYE